MATVTVFSTNSAPVLETGIPMALAAINENDDGNAGTLVTSIIASAGGTPITDSDANAVEGIAVTATDAAHGAWQYSTDNGNTWNAFGSPSNSSARLLAADAGTRIRFVPNLGFFGTVSDGITLRAWDRTNGVYAGVADTTSNGGTTAFSAATENASVTVNAIPAVTGVSPAAGPLTGGTLVTITGSNLGSLSAATVKFGTTEAPSSAIRGRRSRPPARRSRLARWT